MEEVSRCLHGWQSERADGPKIDGREGGYGSESLFLFSSSLLFLLSSFSLCLSLSISLSSFPSLSPSLSRCL